MWIPSSVPQFCTYPVHLHLLASKHNGRSVSWYGSLQLVRKGEMILKDERQRRSARVQVRLCICADTSARQLGRRAQLSAQDGRQPHRQTAQRGISEARSVVRRLHGTMRGFRAHLAIVRYCRSDPPGGAFKCAELTELLKPTVTFADVSDGLRRHNDWFLTTFVRTPRGVKRPALRPI